MAVAPAQSVPTSLTAIKETWMGPVTTILVRQGRYARDPQIVSGYPPADITVDRVRLFLSFDLETLLHGAIRATHTSLSGEIGSSASNQHQRTPRTRA